MWKVFPAIRALLLVAAWQYRDNRPVFFVIVGTLFASAAIAVSASHLPEPILQACAFGWLACMIVAAVFGIGDLRRYIKRRKNAAAIQGSRER